MEKEIEEGKRIETKQFNLIKDLTIAAGSIFGASIALATGSDVSDLFILGEAFLLIVIVIGIVLLYSAIHAEEFSHFILSAFKLKNTLSTEKEEFMKQATKELIDSYENLSKRKNLLSPFFRVIKIDYLYPVFLTSFLIGVFLLFLSLFVSFEFREFIH